MGESKGGASAFSSRKFIIFGILVTLVVLLLAIKERYFYASDCLKPVTSSGTYRKSLGSRKEANNKKALYGRTKIKQKIIDMRNVWDIWMEKNPTLSSIGDIYNKCDNKTRTKIGKVVLEASNKYGGVHVTSYMNCTYNHDIKASTAHLNVFYEGELFYEKDYDMCEAAKKLDTPYSCPIPKGKLLVVRDVATMPGYIPKGSYRIEASVKDQNANEIGCTLAEFKTGEKKT